MFSPSKSRIREPFAVAALLSSGISLQVAWIVNIVWFRQERADALGTLYLFVASVHVIIFVLTTAWYQGRDCSGLRDRAYHFLLISILMFSAMTLPFVYGFSL